MDKPPAEDAGDDGPHQDLPLTVGERICKRRNALGWRQPRLARHVREIGARVQGGAPRQKSLVEMFDRWKGDSVIPDQFNPGILATTLACSANTLASWCSMFVGPAPWPGRLAHSPASINKRPGHLRRSRAHSTVQQERQPRLGC